MGLRDVEEDLHLVADLDLVGKRDLGDEVAAGEVAMDVVLVAEELGNGNGEMRWKTGDGNVYGEQSGFLYHEG